MLNMIQIYFCLKSIIQNFLFSSLRNTGSINFIGNLTNTEKDKLQYLRKYSISFTTLSLILKNYIKGFISFIK